MSFISSLFLWISDKYSSNSENLDSRLSTLLRMLVIFSSHFSGVSEVVIALDTLCDNNLNCAANSIRASPDIKVFLTFFIFDLI